MFPTSTVEKMVRREDKRIRDAQGWPPATPDVLSGLYKTAREKSTLVQLEVADESTDRKIDAIERAIKQVVKKFEIPRTHSPTGAESQTNLVHKFGIAPSHWGRTDPPQPPHLAVYLHITSMPEEYSRGACNAACAVIAKQLWIPADSVACKISVEHGAAIEASFGGLQAVRPKHSYENRHLENRYPQHTGSTRGAACAAVPARRDALARTIQDGKMFYFRWASQGFSGEDKGMGRLLLSMSHVYHSYAV